MALLSPQIASLNLSGLLADHLLGDRQRTPANPCWIARKNDCVFYGIFYGFFYGIY
ncbi:MAG: hypothetical protein SNJ57_18350 [Cyanobacteriota bacterium]